MPKKLIDMPVDYSEIEEIIRSSKRKRKILVLGSNYPSHEAAKREDLIRHFRILGYKDTSKMEDIIRKNAELDQRFFELFQSHDAIIAILSRDAAREGVCWELGFMQGLSYHRMEWLYDRLFICIQGGVAGIKADCKDAITKMVSAGILSRKDIKTIPFEDNTSLLREALAQIEAHFVGYEYQ